MEISQLNSYLPEGFLVSDLFTFGIRDIDVSVSQMMGHVVSTVLLKDSNEIYTHVSFARDSKGSKEGVRKFVEGWIISHNRAASGDAGTAIK